MNTGVLDVPVTATQAQIPLTDTLDPVGTAEKLAAAAQAAPQVAYNLATGLTQMPLSSSASTSSTSSSGPPMAQTINQPMIAQERWYYCMPASVQMFLASAGVGSPSQDDLANRLGTKHPEGSSANPTSGTPAKNAVAVINRIRTQGDRIIWHQIDSPNTLMTYITEDVYRWRHAAILPLNPSYLKSWSGRGTKHGVVAHGYDHRGAGKVYIMDPYDYTRFNWTEAKWGGGNPGGSHTPDLASVHAGVKALGAHIIW